MTISFPNIYGLSIENLKQKIDFYDSIGLHDVTIVDPKQLMQGIELSYARYMFYQDNDEEINIGNYKRLFIAQHQFEKKYKISREELLAKYKYSETVEDENDRESVCLRLERKYNQNNDGDKPTTKRDDS